ncbi:MAG: DJ-1/PfpI family protein, partial [Methylocystaceae bacterium]
KKVGILLFDDVEILDFAGPFEVLSIAEAEPGGGNPFAVKTISETGELVTGRNGLKIQPDYGFKDQVDFDIIIIPGGPGTYQIETQNDSVIGWIREQASKAEITASVCTGAFLLAKAGILKGKKATTHWRSLDRLGNEYPQVLVQRGIKYVDEGSVITSAGISAGIDMALYLVRKLVGNQVAVNTARRMEYTFDAGALK